MIFCLFSRFLYCETASITFYNVSSLLYTSKKYFLPDLTTSCKTFLEQNLNMENVCTIIDQSIFYDEEELTEKCLRYIGPRAQTVFGQESFLNLSQAAVAKIAQHDYLYMESESTLYRACLQWSRHNCMLANSNREPDEKELREMLADVIHHIRFPNMDAIEFAKEVGKGQVLTHEEKSLLYYYILMHENPHSDTSLMFDCGKRVQICSRFPSNGSAQQWWSCNGPTDSVTFQTDREIELIGVALYGGKERSHHELHNRNKRKFCRQCSR